MAKKRPPPTPAQKEKTRQRAAAWHLKNKAYANAECRKRHAKNKQRDNAKAMKYHNTNRETHLENMKTYREAHKEQRNARDKERRLTDPVFVAAGKARGALTRFVKRQNGRKSSSTFALVGCSPAALRTHLGQQLRPGEVLRDMEMDHIFPLAAYGSATAAAQKKLMHWTNVQPLSKVENAFKRARMPTKAMAAKVDRSCWPDGVTEDMLPTIYPGWSSPLRM